MKQPPAFEPVLEIEIAAWLTEAIERHWGRDRRSNFAAAVVPNGFAGYARVFHPAYHPEDRREISWAEVSDHTGRKAHGQMQWQAITRPVLAAGQTTAFGEPATGSLPEKQAVALVERLRDHTTTPELCYFAIWDGWGSLVPGEPWASAARLHLPDRSHYLMRGTIDAATKSVSPTVWQSPSLWWPSDRAWCVATEVDLMSTYVGGTADCIEHILGHPRLEAWPATRDDRVDIEGDKFNR